MSLPFRTMNARLRLACQRLGLARHEMRKLARLAESPEALDPEFLVFSGEAFRRHLHTLAAEAGDTLPPHALCMFALQGERVDLHHAVQILNGGTRGHDIVARTGRNDFTLLLRDCRVSGARTVARRLAQALRESCFPAGEGTVAWAVSGLRNALREGHPLESLARRLPPEEKTIPLP